MSVDWILETDYVVHGELSLAALAKKYEVSYRLVRETAEREHWEEERELHAPRAIMGHHACTWTLPASNDGTLSMLTI